MFFTLLSAMCRHFYSHSYCHCKAVQVAKANKALKVLQTLKNCPGELNYNFIFLVRVCHPLIFQSSFRSYRVCHSPTCSVHGVQTSANKFHICIVLVAPVKWAIVKALIIHPSWISIGLLSPMQNVGLGGEEGIPGVVCWYCSYL